MNDQKKENNSSLPTTGILLLLSVIGTLLFVPEISLKTSRPIDSRKTEYVSSDKVRVPSRLWQDPFEAVETYKLNAAKEPPPPQQPEGVESLVSSINKSLTLLNSTKLLVLPVMVDGNIYSSGMESRLNDRYAVISAFGKEGYIPESGEHIHFFEYPTKDPQIKDPKIIPFELFIPKAKIRDKEKVSPVLVLWLKEQDLGDKPLEYLDKLLRAINKDINKIETSYKVLGPRLSTGLKTMLDELPNQRSNKLFFHQLKGFQLYSFSATAQDTFLIDCSPDPKISQVTGKCKETVEKLFKDQGIELIRTIGTDAALAEQLIRELKRREVNLPLGLSSSNKKYPKVALLSEWDTLYGRALPRTFAAVALNEGRGKTSPELKNHIEELRKDNWPSWIVRTSYLAGLDGELPTKVEEKGNQEKNMTGAEKQATNQEIMERPDGRSQLDYIRRLAASLKHEQKKDGEEFKAIGVLGSDVYDKLLILRALRPLFPNAIFFTTDLHAALAHPSEWQSTHNLIVASHFGLELHQKLQTPIPPFRDSYQTALFYAALQALKPVTEGAKSAATTEALKPVNAVKSAEHVEAAKSAKFLPTISPRLYEIGRNGPFDISPDLESEQYLRIHPPRSDLKFFEADLKKLKNIVLIIILLVVIAALIYSRIMDAIFKFVSNAWSNAWFWVVMILVTLVFSSLVLWVWLLVPMLKNEPFVLIEGISIWLSTAIQLLAWFLCCVFLWYTWWKLKDNESGLVSYFGFEEKADKTDFTSNVIRYSLKLYKWRPSDNKEKSAVAELWHEYAAYGNLKHALWRVLPQTFLSILVLYLLFESFGFPHIPCREEGCFSVHNTLMWVTVFTMMILIFYVIDATRHCRKLVNCIADRKVFWSNKVCQKISEKQGVSKNDLMKWLGIDQKVSKNNLEEWMGIELIARRTQALNSSIYFPVIIIILLGISRHTYFDNWDFPVAMIIFFLSNLALVFINVWSLRESAGAAKQEAIKRLEEKLSLLSEGEQQEKQQVRFLINKIENNHTGAYLPLVNHPVFGAPIALSSGGYGFMLLFEYLAKA